MKLLIPFLVVVVLLLQYELWFAHGGLTTESRLQHQIGQQAATNDQLQAKNQALIADIHSLRRGDQAIEAHARNDLGMVKQDETFYQVTTSEPPSDNSNS